MGISTILDINVPESVKEIPRDFEGYAFISDIDSTYLATEIDSLGGLLKTAFEAPERKSNIPGFSILLRAVRRGSAAEPKRNPVFFVSASPPQMAGKILAKMSLDGVEHDGAIFKNQLRFVRNADFKKLREQISYKLGALLSLWEFLPKHCKIVLFGDDSESDAVIFSLFAEVLAGNVQGRELYNLLRFLGVYREEAMQVAWYSRRFKEPAFPIAAAFINLATGSLPSYYSRLGPFIYPTDNSLQTSLVLAEHGLIRSRAIRSVAKNLFIRHDYSPEQLGKSLKRALGRAMFSKDTLDAYWPILAEEGYLPPKKFLEGDGELEGSIMKIQEWKFDCKKVSLNELKRRFSDEGRY